MASPRFSRAERPGSRNGQAQAQDEDEDEDENLHFPPRRQKDRFPRPMGEARREDALGDPSHHPRSMGSRARSHRSIAYRNHPHPERSAWLMKTSPYPRATKKPSTPFLESPMATGTSSS